MKTNTIKCLFLKVAQGSTAAKFMRLIIVLLTGLIVLKVIIITLMVIIMLVVIIMTWGLQIHHVHHHGHCHHHHGHHRHHGHRPGAELRSADGSSRSILLYSPCLYHACSLSSCSLQVEEWYMYDIILWNVLPEIFQKRLRSVRETSRLHSSFPGGNFSFDNL